MSLDNIESVGKEPVEKVNASYRLVGTEANDSRNEHELNIVGDDNAYLAKLGFPEIVTSDVTITAKSNKVTSKDGYEEEGSSKSFSKKEFENFLVSKFDRINKDGNSTLDLEELEGFKDGNGLSFKQRAMLDFGIKNYAAMRDLSRGENKFALYDGISKNDIKSLGQKHMPEISTLGYLSGATRNGAFNAFLAFEVGGWFAGNVGQSPRGKLITKSAAAIGALGYGTFDYSNQRSNVSNLYKYQKFQT